MSGSYACANVGATVTVPPGTSASRPSAAADRHPFGSQTAAGVLVTVPLVVMVLVFQRRIVAGLTAGAAK